MEDDGLRQETLCIHAGQQPDPIHGAVMTPIVLSSTFAQQGPGGYKDYDYSRAGNPTRTDLDGCIAAAGSPWAPLPGGVPAGPRGREARSRVRERLRGGDRHSDGSEERRPRSV